MKYCDNKRCERNRDITPEDEEQLKYGYIEPHTVLLNNEYGDIISLCEKCYKMMEF